MGFPFLILSLDQNLAPRLFIESAVLEETRQGLPTAFHHCVYNMSMSRFMHSSSHGLQSSQF